MPTERRGRRSLPAALLLAVVPALPACRSMDAKVYNLRELHHEDGKASYRAALMGDMEYNLRRSLRVSAPLGLELDFSGKEAELVSDPASECLQNLLGFAAYESSSQRVLALSAELYSWLATSDPYVLARERCLLEIGPIAAELGVREPLQAEGEPPDVEELTRLITDLVAASRPVLKGKGGPTGEGEDAERALVEACEALSALDHDIRTGRRVLRTSAALLGAKGGRREELEPLRVAMRAVAWRVVSLAMTQALADPEPLVRGTALQAWVVATDNRAGEVLASASRDPDPLVVHCALRLVAEHGLPAPLDPDIDADEWRESWIANLVQAAVSPDGRVSAAACRALGVISGADFESLRFNDWYGWWLERAEVMQLDGNDGRSS